jgi:hypothetical protein
MRPQRQRKRRQFILTEPRLKALMNLDAASRPLSQREVLPGRRADLTLKTICRFGWAEKRRSETRIYRGRGGSVVYVIKEEGRQMIKSARASAPALARLPDAFHLGPDGIYRSRPLPRSLPDAGEEAKSPPPANFRDSVHRRHDAAGASPKKPESLPEVSRASHYS